MASGHLANNNLDLVEAIPCPSSFYAAEGIPLFRVSPREADRSPYLRVTIVSREAVVEYGDEVIDRVQIAHVAAAPPSMEDGQDLLDRESMDLSEQPPQLSFFVAKRGYVFSAERGASANGLDDLCYGHNGHLGAPVAAVGHRIDHKVQQVEVDHIIR